MKPQMLATACTLGMMGAQCGSNRSSEQQRCVGYMKHPTAVLPFCWFNYNAQDKITDCCFRPGILKDQAPDQ